MVTTQILPGENLCQKERESPDASVEGVTATHAEDAVTEPRGGTVCCLCLDGPKC